MNEEKIVEEIVKIVKKQTSKTPKPNWNNFDYVLSSIKQNGYALQYASPELKNNFDIVLEAVKRNGNAFYYASPELKNKITKLAKEIKK